MKSCMKSVRDNMLRKVRIIVSDPYATDDSSSEEELELPKPRKVKRIAYEINIHSQLSERCQDRCDGVKTSRKKSPRQSKKPVGVRLRPSGRWAAEITNPITKTRKWLGTYETPEEAEKAYADKKVEYDTLASSSPAVSSSVVSVNSQCLRSPASASAVDRLSKENMSLNKDVSASGDSAKEVLSNFDFSALQIPDLSFIAAADLDLDFLLMDDDSGHLLDDFSLLDNDINICGF